MQGDGFRRQDRPRRDGVDAAAAVARVVAVPDFLVLPVFIDADAVMAADDGRKVAEDEDAFRRGSGGAVLPLLPSRRRACAVKGDDAVVPVVAADPVKALPVEIDLPQGGMGQIERVQVPDVVPHGPVLGVVQQ